MGSKQEDGDMDYSVYAPNWKVLVLLIDDKCPLIYEVLLNEDTRPLMKAALADGTLAWGHSPLHVKRSTPSHHAGLHLPSPSFASQNSDVSNLYSED